MFWRWVAQMDGTMSLHGIALLDLTKKVKRWLVCFGWSGSGGCLYFSIITPKKNWHDDGESPFLIGDTSSNGWVFHCHVGFQWCMLLQKNLSWKGQQKWCRGSWLIGMLFTFFQSEINELEGWWNNIDQVIQFLTFGSPIVGEVTTNFQPCQGKS